jgi:hypothetical protein
VGEEPSLNLSIHDAEAQPLSANGSAPSARSSSLAMDLKYWVDSEGFALDAQGMTARFAKHVRAEIGDTWQKDPKFFEKFFPIDPKTKTNYANARKLLYNDRESIKRWKKVSRSPRSASSLLTPLRTLMNDILDLYNIHPDSRLFLDTHSGPRKVACRFSPPVSPSLFLAGIGPEFINTYAEVPRANYSSGMTVLEVVLNDEDLDDARDRLAVYVHQLFQHQDNRRFAYGVVITEDMFTVYMFDHSGVVASEPCNYHEHAEQFCAVISGLASDDARRFGFDTTMFSEGRHQKIRTFEVVKRGAPTKTHYIIKNQLFRYPSLVGRGTLCWLVSPEKNPDTACVVKDAWIAPSELLGRESEGSLLHHAQAKGVINGVAQVRHFEEVRNGRNASLADTVLRNRCLEDVTPEDMKFERVHTRIVMTTHGKTLDMFASRKELLLAYHDAIVGA